MATLRTLAARNFTVEAHVGNYPAGNTCQHADTNSLAAFLVGAGEFHYYHHLNPKVNFAEEEWIDHLFGTHHTYSAWWTRFQLKQKQQRQQRPTEPAVKKHGGGWRWQNSALAELYKNFPELLVVTAGSLCAVAAHMQAIY